jgi:prolipoprotein diacylglyceryltransferase
MLLQPWLKKRGAMFGMLCVLYAIGRFTIDFFRYYEPNARVVGGLSFNQVICVFVFFFGIFLLMRKERAPVTS